MARVLTENFEEYGLNLLTPIGPWNGSGRIVQDTTPPSRLMSRQAMSLGNIITAFQPFQIGSGGFSFWVGDSGTVGGVIFSLINWNSFDPSTAKSLANIIFEKDHSITLANHLTTFVDADTTDVCNSGIKAGYYLQLNTWYFFTYIWKCTLGDALDGEDPKQIFIAFDVIISDNAVNLRGNRMLTGWNIVPGNADAVANLDASIDGIGFASPVFSPGNAMVDNIYVGGGGDPDSGDPAIPPLPNAILSQAAVEHAAYGVNPQARVSQLAVEFPGLYFPKIRVSQLAVEIMSQGQGVPVATTPWLVKES